MLLQMVFFLLALTLGEHWQKSEEELNPAAAPLARMLSKLPVAASKAIDTYLDPLIFVMAIAALCAEPLKIEGQKKANKNAPNVPVDQTQNPVQQYADTTHRDDDNNFRGMPPIF